ncbi:hypothetical protein GH5_05229 [Leishmania sp. Ghana 2012 LV757]|uniref:hypothetical protein n=1 Tax=Leishmania sp. Ghana 2012 LV757 TaxID=2803181 RepID=UPI001B6B83BF|nr:hypothetical protein GH5_05229 [Leishmania sp. Ghana 2012 LV757]
MGCSSSKVHYGILQRIDCGGGGPAEKMPSGKKAQEARKLNGVAVNGGDGALVQNNCRVFCSGISAYRPDAETAKAYYEQVMELRRVGVAQGILPVVNDDSPLLPELTCSRHDSRMRKNDTNDAVFQSNKSHRAATTDRDSGVVPPARTLTVYQCQPLAGDTVVAKGMYSTVHVARLSVFTGPLDGEVSATMPRYAPTRRDNTNSAAGGADPCDHSSISFSVEAISPKSHVSCSVPTDTTSARCSSPTDAIVSASTVTPMTALACTNASHYIIAMKEIPLYRSYATSGVLEQVCLEVRRWTRLSTYCPRLLRCYQLEYAFSEGVSMSVPEASYQFFPGRVNSGSGRGVAGAGLSTDASFATDAADRAENNKKLFFRTFSHLFVNSSSRSSNPSPISQQPQPVSGTPRKLRLYLEYAKHGTLRGFQVKEMPELFGRRRLHELTARAYMRDLLLALLQLHEGGELQYDLCAKAVFLHRPILKVYRTYFPAYISDLPTGDLTSVTPSQLAKALGSLDPPPPPRLTKESPCKEPINETTSPRLGHSRRGPGEQRNTVSSPAQRAGHATVVESDFTCNVSSLVRDTSCARQMSVIDVHPGGSNGTSVLRDAGAKRAEEQRNGNTTTVECETTVTTDLGNTAFCASSIDHASLASPSRKLFAAESGVRGGPATSAGPAKTPARAGYSATRGSLKPKRQGSVKSVHAASMHELGDDDGTRCHLHKTYRRYMEEFEFKLTDDGDSLPFPSPHDGVGAQADAEMLASTIIPEEPCESPMMRVVPLQCTNLGGIAILSPDHYVVKPTEVPLPDLRGRLPILLAPSTSRAALAGGGLQHRRLVTRRPTSAAAPALVPRPCSGQFSMPQALSAGTSRADAAGSLGRCRGGAPLVKLNHTSLIRRALGFADCDKLEDVPVYKYVTVTHAAPEVLHRRLFSPASDIYAFAMTFIELVSDNGTIMEDCLPTNLPAPVTRRDMQTYDRLLSKNLAKWYQSHISDLPRNSASTRKRQEVADPVSPPTGPIVVRLPQHLSDECKRMLQWCLQHDPKKRPTAAELLRSRYFMLGDWIAVPSASAAEEDDTQLPESPWLTSISFEAAARAAGLPALNAKCEPTNSHPHR